MPESVQLSLRAIPDIKDTAGQVPASAEEIHVLVLPGGRPPKRQNEDDVGYDASTRAIICPSLAFDDVNPAMRKTLFDFKEPAHDHTHRGKIKLIPGRGNPDEWVWVMEPGEHVFLGLGVVLGLTSPWRAHTVPRGSTPNRHFLMLLDATVPIDSGFRGEPVAHLWHTGKESFPLRHGNRFVQFEFWKAELPTLVQLPPGEVLPVGIRGTNCNGSTRE